MVDGIGPCSVGLRGSSADGRVSARLLTHVNTGAIYVLFNDQGERRCIAVTAIPPCDLLCHLAKFEWRYAFDPVDETA